MTHGSLFSGIGGFDLAAEWMGWENVFHCEIAEFPRKVLKYHFPKSICYEDIKKTDFTKHRGKIDIISGGFPCQPYSNAGKRKGKEDDRHLWPEMLRVIREVQPRFVVGENVSGLLTWNNGMVFHEIITDLENEGYETQAFLIPACATNAPHRRDRIWFVAHTKRNGRNERGQKVDEREINKFQNRDKIWDKFTSNGKQSNVAHSNGTEQGNDIGENIGEEGEIRWGKESNVFGELRGDGIITDTDGKRHTSYGKSKSIEGNWSGNNREQKEWSKQTKRINGLDGLSRITTDSDNGSGLRKTVQTRRTEFEELHDSPSNAAHTESKRTWEQSSEDRGRENRRFDNNGKEWNVADTTYSRLQRRQEIDQWEKHNSKRGRNGFDIGAVSENIGRQIRGDFENFPTQSPICGGDDGISTQLDGITFSKWRNESIKGYGNAVVSQVVYQIFKAIEQSIAE